MKFFGIALVVLLGQLTLASSDNEPLLIGRIKGVVQKSQNLPSLNDRIAICRFSSDVILSTELTLDFWNIDVESDYEKPENAKIKSNPIKYIDPVSKVIIVGEEAHTIQNKYCVSKDVIDDNDKQDGLKSALSSINEQVLKIKELLAAFP
jgi:hypothetical protein